MRLDVPSPFGPLSLEERDGAIVSLSWGARGGTDETPALAEARRQLASYFVKDLQRFDLPLALHGPAFHRQVWTALCQIPFGRTKTYGDLAFELNAMARAVGQACGANPIPIIVPCHRVMAAGGRDGGFSGFRGVETKRRLLAHEGVMAPELPFE
jgi:methylated-DNA-[protein]-cysteine S-methyltransferase